MISRIGVDGCPGGWFYVEDRAGALRYGVVARLAPLIDGAPPGSRVFVDIPIGLSESGAESRACDRAARRLLGRARGASVFPAPARAVLDAASHAEAVARSRSLGGKGLSRQAFAIAARIREVDQLLAADRRARALVREVHPELCFWSFARGRAMRHPKRSAAGFTERKDLLERLRPGSSALIHAVLADTPRRQVGRDDVVDALAALLTACAPGECLRRLPAELERDARGLPMEMVYLDPGC